MQTLLSPTNIGFDLDQTHIDPESSSSNSQPQSRQNDLNHHSNVLSGSGSDTDEDPILDLDSTLAKKNPTLRKGLTDKRERPLSLFLDLPTATFPSNLNEFLRIQLRPEKAAIPSPINNENPPTRSLRKARSTALLRKPLRNLLNFVNMEFSKLRSKGKLKSPAGPIMTPTTHGIITAEYADQVTTTDTDDDDLESEDTPLSPSAMLGRGQAVKTRSAINFPPNQAPNTSPTRSRPNRTIRRIQLMYTAEPGRQAPVLEHNSVLGTSSLKHFKVDNDLTPRISTSSLHDIMCGKHSHEFDEFIIIDCRFGYEYEGGHINGAINVNCQQQLEDKYIIGAPEAINKLLRTLVILHCEFSIFRGPTMASHLRKLDRIHNAMHYPKLTYPDVVILDGGYKQFFEQFPTMCLPQAYVEMKDINHEKTCQVEMDRVRQASKLTRAKLYNHFKGQSGSLINGGLGNNLTSSSSNNVLGKLPRKSTRPALFHTRLASFTTITLHLENLKILKRQRLLNRLGESENESEDDKIGMAGKFSDKERSKNDLLPPSPNMSPFDLEFQPPTALFRLSSSLRQLHTLLLLLLINLYLLDAFLLTDLLTDMCLLPLMEFGEWTEPKKKENRTRIKRYTNGMMGGNLSCNTSSKVYLMLPLPMVNLPLLTITPSSEIGTGLSLIDPINDAPVDFLVPIIKQVHARRRSGLMLSSGCYSFVALDIDEIDEEDDADGTLTDIH